MASSACRIVLQPCAGARGGFRGRSGFDFLDDTRADHHGVRVRGDGLRAGGVADAEAHADRQLTCLRICARLRRDIGGIDVPGARHALQRHVVDVAARDLGDRGDARFRRRRRQQEDRRDVARGQHLREVGGLFGRIVDDQDAVDAGRLGAIRERRHAHRFDRIGVAHEHDRRHRVGAAEVANHVEDVVQADALRQRAFARALDHRPVGHRIGKRHAQLDDVRAGRDQRVHDRARRGERRVARSDVGNQRRASGGLELREGGVDAVQRARRRVAFGTAIELEARALGHGVHVLVAAAGKIDQQDLVLRQASAPVASRTPARAPIPARE